MITSQHVKNAINEKPCNSECTLQGVIMQNRTLSLYALLFNKSCKRNQKMNKNNYCTYLLATLSLFIQSMQTQ